VGKMPNAKQLAVIIIGIAFISLMVFAIVVPIFSGFGIQPIVNSEGVYVYYHNKWIKENTNNTAWFPKDNGTYLIYLRNLNCPACQNFDPVWSEYMTNYLLSKNPYNITPVEIVCTYFSSSCTDPSAKATFSFYEQLLGNYFGTPYLVLISNLSFIYYNFPPINNTGYFDASLLNQTISTVLYNYLNKNGTS
jgi:hypothetical protein